VARPSAVPEALWRLDSSGALLAFDGRVNQVSARVHVGGTNGGALAVGGGLLWAYQLDLNRITLVDPVRAEIVGQVSLPAARPLADNQISYAHGALWVAQPGRLWRLDPTGDPVPTDLPAGFGSAVIATTDRWLWLASGRQLVRIDPASRAVATVPVSFDVSVLSGTSTSLYAAGINSRAVSVLAPDTGAVRSFVRFPGEEYVSAVATAGTTAWAIGSDSVQRIDDGGRSAPTSVCSPGGDLTAVAALGSLWVAADIDSTVIRVDLDTGQVRARIRYDAEDPDDPEYTVVAGQRTVWVLDGVNTVARVDPDTDGILHVPTGRDQSFAVAAVAAPSPR
jgi:hypothetical protein